MNSITHLLSAVAVAMVFLLPSPVQAKKIKLLIIDGQNNHNWAGMTPVNKKTLESTGLFTVDVSTTPPKKSKKEEWKDWRPDFSK